MDGSREDSVRPFRVRSVAVTDASLLPPVSGRYQIIVCLHLSLELMIRPPFHRAVMRRILRSAAETPYTRCLSLGELLRSFNSKSRSVSTNERTRGNFSRRSLSHAREREREKKSIDTGAIAAGLHFRNLGIGSRESRIRWKASASEVVELTIPSPVTFFKQHTDSVARIYPLNYPVCAF